MVKAHVFLSFSIDGREPSDKELDAVAIQIINEWPTWVYPYGDDDDSNGAAVLEQVAVTWGGV